MATLRSSLEETATHGAGPAGLDAVFERLAARLGESARAAHVFGEAVERDGVTVVPVATARWGVGGGSGPKKGEGMGSGGGGGAVVRPIGYIEIRAGGSRFRPLWDAKTVLSGVVMAGALLVLALKRR